MLIDEMALLVADLHEPLSNARAAAWSLYWDSINRAGVTATTSSAAAIGIRPRSPIGSARRFACRPASAAPPTAKNQTVTAGISQSQSTPAWIAHARPAANSAA